VKVDRDAVRSFDGVLYVGPAFILDETALGKEEDNGQDDDAKRGAGHDQPQLFRDVQLQEFLQRRH
jgi:hypothetical protein